MVHVAPSQRLHRGQVKDEWVNTTGYVEPFYPKISIFYVLGSTDVLFF
jgi:hypothetical protein